MAERKVLVKYFPKNFNADLLVKRGRGKDKLMIVRNMLPMSLRCNQCANYLYVGTKFNMRMEICNDQTYLGIKVFRFYLKCTYCYSDITFKTDPKNHDYVVELGGTRNYEPLRDTQEASKLLRKMKKDQKEGDSMKFLESRTYDSKREMELNQALEDIKTLNKRQAVIDPEDLLKNMLYTEVEEGKFTADQEQEIDKQFQQMQTELFKELRQKYCLANNTVGGVNHYNLHKAAQKVENRQQDKQIKKATHNLQKVSPSNTFKKKPEASIPKYRGKLPKSIKIKKILLPIRELQQEYD